MSWRAAPWPSCVPRRRESKALSIANLTSNCSLGYCSSHLYTECREGEKDHNPGKIQGKRELALSTTCSQTLAGIWSLKSSTIHKSRSYRRLKCGINLWAKTWGCIVLNSEEKSAKRIRTRDCGSSIQVFIMIQRIQKVTSMGWTEKKMNDFTVFSRVFITSDVWATGRRSLCCFGADFIGTEIIVDIFQREGTECTQERHWADRHKISKFCHQCHQGPINHINPFQQLVPP